MERNGSEISKSNNIFMFTLVFTVIVISSDTLLFGTNKDQFFIWIKYTIQMMMLALLIFNIMFKRLRLDFNTLIITISMLLIIFISGSIDSKISFGYFYKSLLIILSFFVVSYLPLNTFIIYYDRIMKTLAFLSLIGYFGFLLYKEVANYFPTVINTAGREFYNLFIIMIPNYGYDGVLIRNWGVFREPGVFQMYLIFALLLQLFVFSRVNIKTSIIYIIAIITTYSTTAYIVLIILIMTYFMSKSKSQHKEKKTIALFLLITILGIMLLYSDTVVTRWDSVFGKISDPSHGSMAARLASVTVNIELFIDAPLFGVGFNNLADKFQYLALKHTGVMVRDNTNTMLIQFAAHGLLYGLIWIYGYWKLCRRLSSDIIKSIVFFVIFILLFIGENLSWGFLLYVLLFYGFDRYKKIRIK